MDLGFFLIRFKAFNRREIKTRILEHADITKSNTFNPIWLSHKFTFPLGINFNQLNSNAAGE